MKIQKRNLTQAKLARAIAEFDPEGYGGWFTHELGEYLESVMFGDGDVLDPFSLEDYQRFIEMLAQIEAENEFTYLWMALTRFDFCCGTSLFNDLSTELFGEGIDVGAWADEHPDNLTPPARKKYQRIAVAASKKAG